MTDTSEAGRKLVGLKYIVYFIRQTVSLWSMHKQPFCNISRFEDVFGTKFLIENDLMVFYVQYIYCKSQINKCCYFCMYFYLFSFTPSLFNDRCKCLTPRGSNLLSSIFVKTNSKIIQKFKNIVSKRNFDLAKAEGIIDEAFVVLMKHRYNKIEEYLIFSVV